jgi:hypothetical protein
MGQANAECGMPNAKWADDSRDGRREAECEPGCRGAEELGGRTTTGPEGGRGETTTTGERPRGLPPGKISRVAQTSGFIPGETEGGMRNEK